jgi:modulator of FtsH protease HflC
MSKLSLALPAIIAVAVAGSQFLYTVDEREYAVVFQLGEVVRVETTPGIKTKVPLVQNVRKFDKRIITLDAANVETFATAEKQPIEVDSFVKWQVADPKTFYVSTNQGDMATAERRIQQTINSLLGEELQKRTLQEIVSGEREKIMEAVRMRGDGDLSKIGVKVVDVRLKRVELPKQVSEKVFDRMRSERLRVANELRSQGAADSEKIKADADKQRQVILAEAYKQAQSLQGAGDGKSAAIYGAAYGQNAEFYSFYRSLEAYKASFRSKNDVMVLEPNAAFFRYLRNGSGTGGAAK